MHKKERYKLVVEEIQTMLGNTQTISDNNLSKVLNNIGLRRSARKKLYLNLQKLGYIKQVRTRIDFL